MEDFTLDLCIEVLWAVSECECSGEKDRGDSDRQRASYNPYAKVIRGLRG